MKNVKIKIGLILLASLYLGGSFLLEKYPVGIRINLTPSLPHKCFLSTPFRTPKRYSYVGLKHFSNSRLLAKQIIGLPGDSITLQNDHIFVNNYDCGKAFNTTSSGLALTPIDTGNVPEGYIFVHAFHSESFDSRYQQFGLVPIEQLEETLWPIY